MTRDDDYKYHTAGGMVPPKWPGNDAVKHLTIQERKREGAHYTPTLLADFVADQICRAAFPSLLSKPVRVLDPAVGDGELLGALLTKIAEADSNNVTTTAFDTDEVALNLARERILDLDLDVAISWQNRSFLDFVLEEYVPAEGPLFSITAKVPRFDLLIANPPYVRTQVLGAKRSRALAQKFHLTGRVDLYHAFILAMGEALAPGGVAGIIVSNRFMTTRAGAGVRKGIRQLFDVLHVWDLGDTKLFEAAVLPAVLLLRRRADVPFAKSSRFTSIYTAAENGEQAVPVQNVIQALAGDGPVQTPEGEVFTVRQGTLADGRTADAVWRLSNKETDSWLRMVQEHTACCFADVGKIRVGVKTTADKVFIRSDWTDLPADQRPELLKPLITHHVARRFRAQNGNLTRKILYPHIQENGKRSAVDLEKYPRSKQYLEAHREILEKRTYLQKSGRAWFEIWVPQSPQAWSKPKLVFRDICEHPVFWIDLSGAVVNGDCYWLPADDPEAERMLWLASAVGNSSFIEEFYDRRFNNKLYARRRRFLTQYVEQFPLPDPDGAPGRAIISLAREIYDKIENADVTAMEEKIDALVWKAFGFSQRSPAAKESAASC